MHTLGGATLGGRDGGGRAGGYSAPRPLRRNLPSGSRMHRGDGSSDLHLNARGKPLSRELGGSEPPLRILYPSRKIPGGKNSLSSHREHG